MTIASVTNSSAAFALPVGQQSMSTTYKSLITVGNSTATSSLLTYVNARRGMLFDLVIGTNGAPASNYMEFDVAMVTYGASFYANSGCSAISSVSSSFMLNFGDAGFQAACNVNSSVETQVVANNEKFYIGLNQQASYRWVAAPGSEMYWPANTSATGNNGLALRARSGAYTGTATGNVLFNEIG